MPRGEKRQSREEKRGRLDVVMALSRLNAIVIGEKSGKRKRGGCRPWERGGKKGQDQPAITEKQRLGGG